MEVTFEPTTWEGLAEEDRNRVRGILSKLLHETIVQVTFRKKDGTERVMNCSLKSDLIENYVKKTDTTKGPNPDVCPVFDTDKREWRSFRYDSISNVTAE